MKSVQGKISCKTSNYNQWCDSVHRVFLLLQKSNQNSSSLQINISRSLFIFLNLSFSESAILRKFCEFWFWNILLKKVFIFFPGDLATQLAGLKGTLLHLLNIHLTWTCTPLCALNNAQCTLHLILVVHLFDLCNQLTSDDSQCKLNFLISTSFISSWKMGFSFKFLKREKKHIQIWE